MIGLRKYIGLSGATASAVIYHAFYTREQFFPAVYYLSTSKIAIAVLGNLAFALALTLYNLTTKVFLGTLRESEVERINDRISQAVMETCLAMTIFRDEFNVEFVAMFVGLTFVKVFHWLVQDRVDYIETTPTVSRLHHFRIVSFMMLLLGIDSLFLQFTIHKTLERSASVHLLFAFEYVIQCSIVVSTFIKYLLSAFDNYMDGRWENKGVYVFYLQLLTDMLHLCVYLVFFVIVFTNYGLPLHLVRDLYWTFRNFRNRVADFLRYRRVTANMDERFPDATAEDLERSDNICIICREEMTASSKNKKLTCNHVFHLHCLRSWLERQQSCPTCRTSVLAPRTPRPPPQQPGVPPAQDAGAAAHLPGQFPQHQQQPHAHGHQVPVGAAAATGPTAGANAGSGGPQPSGSSGQQPSGSGGNASGAGGSSGGAGGSSSGQGAGDRDGPGRGNQGSGGGGPISGAQPQEANAEQQEEHSQQGQQTSQAQPAGSWAAANYGYVWNMPQWVPATSMALFAPAMGYQHMQYAGQTNPASVAPELQGHVNMLPMLPLLPFPPTMPNVGIPAIPVGATPEQQTQHHAAAAAATAAAAAAASMMSPFGSMMMPPTMVPPGSPMPSVLPLGGGAESTAAAAAASAANAAAHAAAAAVMNQPVASVQASTETMEQVLRQQLDMLQHQVSQLSMHRQHWHQQQQEQAAIAASAEDAQEAGQSSSTSTQGQATPSQQVTSHQESADGNAAPANGQET